MEDKSIVKHCDVSVDLINYSRSYRNHGHIIFELKTEENEELIRATQQFKKIEQQVPGFDKKKWIAENINPMPSAKPFAVFSFLVTHWNPSTIISNVESPNQGYIYVCVANEVKAH